MLNGHLMLHFTDGRMQDGTLLLLRGFTGQPPDPARWAGSYSREFRQGASPSRRRLTSAAGGAIAVRGGAQEARVGSRERAFEVPRLPTGGPSAARGAAATRGPTGARVRA